MKVIILLALIGAAYSLQFPLEYEYKYEGRVATAIPGIHPTAAALGIKADLTMQISSPRQAIAKLSNVLVGNMNGKVSSTFLKQPLPINYKKMPSKEQRMIEEPFSVNLQQDKHNVMEVSAHEPIWITNIRKSIVEMLLLEPIRFNENTLPSDSIFRAMELNESPASFSIQEESIFGRCESQYTITRLPQTVALEADKKLYDTRMEDVQSHKSQSFRSKHLPKLEDHLWRLVRSISFDKCQDRVLHQHSTAGNTSQAGNGQFESLQGRSSVGSFLIRGKPGQFRVESAVVEGSVERKPFGVKSEKLQAITNQTLSLTKAREIESPMQLPKPSRLVRTWRHEIASPFSPPFGSPRPWVRYNAKGNKLSPVAPTYVLLQKEGKQEELRVSLESEISAAAEELDKMPQRPPQSPSLINNEISLPASRLHTAANLLQAMEIEQIERAFRYFFQRKGKKAEIEQALLVDAAAASGSAAPMKVILEKLAKNEITTTRAASIFTTLTSHMSSPAIIPDILSYVKSVDIAQTPYLASACLVNFARLARRACYSTESRNYSMPNEVYGSEACKPSFITKEFVPHLEELLQRSGKPREKTIVIHAMSELGSIKLFPTLVETALGKQGSNPRVRTAAIYAFVRSSYPHSMKQKIMDVLMEIAENMGELPEVRQAAISVIPTLKPDTAVYQRLARSTWREPSQQTAAFTFFTLKSVSESKGPGQEKEAAKAAFSLPLAKPFSPSTHYSFSFRGASYKPEQQIQSAVNFAYIVNSKSAIPKEMYFALSSNIAGMAVTPFQMTTFAEGIETYFPQVLEILHEKGYPMKSDSFHPRNTKAKESEIFAEMRKLSKQLPISSEPEFAVLTKVLDNMITYAPFDRDLVSRIAGKGASDLVRSLKEGQVFNVTKFINPIQNSYSIPTEIGLPLIGSFEMPTVFHAAGHIKLESSGPHDQDASELFSSKKVRLMMKSDFRAIQQFKAKLQVFSPWDESKIEAGVDNVRAVNFPMYTNASMFDSQTKKNFTFNAAPATRAEVPIVYVHNIPYTAIKPIAKLPAPEQPESSTIITLRGNQSPSVISNKEGTCPYSGFAGQVSYIGDIPFPFTASNAMDYIRKPARLSELLTSPNTRLYRTFVVYDPSGSKTKNVSVSVSVETKYAKRYEVDAQYQPEKIESPRQLRERLSSAPHHPSDVKVPIVEAKLMFNGTEYRQFDAIVVASKTPKESQSQSYSSASSASSRAAKSSAYKQYKISSSVRRSPLPELSSSGKEIIVKAIVTAPNITSISSLKRVLQEEEMKSSVKAVIQSSRSSQPAVEFEAKISLSEQRKNIILRELKGSCSYDQETPTTDFQVAAVYDQGEAKLRYRKRELSPSVQNASYIADEIIKGSQYPHVSVNSYKVENPEEEIKMQLSRSIAQKQYSIRVEKPQENINFDKVSLGYLLSVIPASGLESSCQSSSSAVLPDMPLSTCKITKEKITPYNKVSYPSTPLRCWTQAAQNPSKPGDWSIQFREDTEGHMKTKISSSILGVAIRMSQSELQVNGKTISISKSEPYHVKDQTGRSVAQILRLPDQLLYAVIPLKYVVRLHHNTLHIYDLKTHDRLIGVCGTTDSFEMVGPKGCIYNRQNTLLMKYAFAQPEGEGCDHRDYEEQIKEVEEFQRSCTKKTEYLSGQPMSAFKQKSCEKYEYLVKRDSQNSICVTTKPTRKCSSSCYSHGSSKTKMSVKCWSAEQAPKSVEEASETGSMSHPVHEAPSYYTDLVFRIPSRCTKA